MFSSIFKTHWTFKTHWVESISTQSGQFIHNTLLSWIFFILSPPLVQVLCQLSNITIAYHNLGFNSSSLEFLVPMSDNSRPPLRHTVLWKFHPLPFLTNLILLEMCLVCLVSLSFLDIHTAGFISNIMGGACSVTKYGSLIFNSLVSILKFDRDIPKVHTALNSLSALYWSTGPVTCVKWSICTSW